MTAALRGWQRWRSASRLPRRRCPARFPASNPGSPTSSCYWSCCKYGWRAAAWVSGLRVLAGAILLGSLFAPGFWLSAAGACVSLLILALARHLPGQYFGPISLSVLAAFGHIGGQLALAGWWLLPSAAIIGLLPVFAAAALIFGAVNGVIVARLLATPTPPNEQPQES